MPPRRDPPRRAKQPSAESYNLEKNLVNVKKESVNVKEEPVDFEEELVNVKKEPVDFEEELVNFKMEPVDFEEELVNVKREPVDFEEELVSFKMVPVDFEEELVNVKMEPVDVEEELVNVKEEPVDFEEELVNVKKELVTVKKEPVTVKKEPVKVNKPTQVVPPPPESPCMHLYSGALRRRIAFIHAELATNWLDYTLSRTLYDLRQEFTDPAETNLSKSLTLISPVIPKILTPCKPQFQRHLVQFLERCGLGAEVSASIEPEKIIIDIKLGSTPEALELTNSRLFDVAFQEELLNLRIPDRGGA